MFKNVGGGDDHSKDINEKVFKKKIENLYIENVISTNGYYTG